MPVKAAGYWAWLNQYATLPDDKLVARAKQLAALAPTGGVIVKYGQWREFDLLRAYGVRVGVERYCYPGQAFTEGQMLAEGLTRGAEFAVVNAEVEWEIGAGGDLMRQLITEVRRQHPDAEVYGCTDTRSYRFNLPYTRVLLELATGMMPMIYAKEFRQTAAQAFASSLDGKDFRRPDGASVPVLPAIQTYNGAGAALVTAQVEEAARRGLPGCQAYTIAHATDEEWAAFVAAATAAQAATAKEDDMADEELRRYMKVHGILLHAVSDVTQHGLIADANVRGALVYLFGREPRQAPSTNRQAVGALQYAAAQAAQMAAPNAGATAIIRALAAGAQVPADV